MNSVLQISNRRDAEAQRLCELFPTREKILEVGSQLSQLPQTEIRTKHEFADNCYLRTAFMPANTLVIGHIHRTRHLNRMLTGRMAVLMDGRVTEIVAPCEFYSEAGTQKIAIILEDVEFVNVFPLEGLEHCGRDLDKLEEALSVDCAKLAGGFSDALPGTTQGALTV